MKNKTLIIIALFLAGLAYYFYTHQRKVVINLVPATKNTPFRNDDAFDKKI